MTTELPAIAAAYVRAVNDHDPAAFITLFAGGATVSDIGREFRGQSEIAPWSEREIFGPRVTLKVIEVAERDGETVVTTEVDGNFDRTGLPDPVVINHHIRAEGGKIVALTCRLAIEEPGS
jgi:hypothetical protein